MDDRERSLRPEELDRAAAKTALERVFYLFLEKAPEEIRRALKREGLLIRYHHILGRKAFLALVDELAPSLGSERLFLYLQELEEQRAKRKRS